MNNIRLFFSAILSADMIDKLSKSQSHYLTKVMRIKEDESFSLFNKEGEWEGKILSISKSIVEFKITKRLRKKENIKELWLAFSPIKLNYQNFMFQKATELGVTKFLPIIFERTVVRKINNERLKKIVIEASEQSNRINVPIIESSQNLKSFLKKNLINDFQLFISNTNLGNKGKKGIKNSLIILNKKNKYINKVNLLGDKLITYNLK